MSISNEYVSLGGHIPFQDYLQPVAQSAALSIAKAVDKVVASEVFQSANRWRDTITYSAFGAMAIAELLQPGHHIGTKLLFAIVARESVRSALWARSKEYAVARGYREFFHPRDFAEIARAGSMIATIPFALSSISYGVNPEFCKLYAVFAGIMATAATVNVGNPLKVIKDYIVMWDWPRKNARLSDGPPDRGAPKPEMHNEKVIMFPVRQDTKPRSKKNGTYDFLDHNC